MQEFAGKIFKYELPVVNEPISFKSNAGLVRQDAEG